MNQLELLRWAIKAVDTEIKRYSSRLNRYIFIMQAYEKGVHPSYFDLERAKKQIRELEIDIELLKQKKTELEMQIEPKVVRYYSN